MSITKSICTVKIEIILVYFFNIKQEMIMDYSKKTTAGDIFLLMNLIALFAAAYSSERQEHKTVEQIRDEYWSGNNV